MLFGGAAVSWFSRMQQCVATSLSEAEYNNFADSAKDVMVAGQVLNFLRPSVQYLPGDYFL